jgi:hypothetical protein
MKTPALVLEYNQLDQRYQELREALRQPGDTLKIMQEMQDNIERRKQIALECFVTENQPSK